MSTFKPGDSIGGCQIECEIAKGGMGTVYRARQMALDRIVAVKVLKPELSSYPDILKRFLREGKLAAKLDHPGIIHIFDIGQDDGHYFLVMEFVEGKDLCQVIEEKGPFSPWHALDIARKVAGALSYAHEHGIVHRDIKPQNIMLSPDNSIKIADFGIARVMEQETMLTSSGVIIGTPAYMSPEQCRGEAIDGRSDLYNLGATLYTLLCGRVPFSNQNCAALVHQVINDYPQPLDHFVPGLSPSIMALVKRLMAKHPAARFQTGKELIAAIEGIQQKRCVLTTASSSSDSAGSDWPFYLKSFLFLLAFVAAIAASLYFIWPHLEESWAQMNRPAASVSTEETKSPKAIRGRRVHPEEVDLAANEEEMGGEAEAAANNQGDHSSHQDQGVDEALEGRIEAFRDALISGQTKEILEFIDPEVRDNPSLLLSLGSILKKLKGLGGPLAARYKVDSQDDEKTKLTFLFRKRGSPRFFRVNLSWIRGQDNIWYIKPDTAPAPDAPDQELIDELKGEED